MIHDFKVSCVIPAYNEGKRIMGVLEAVIGHPLIDEIIVVDDGSKDGTAELLRNVRDIDLITYSKNRGKSFAVMTGMKRARNAFVSMLDADLLNLTPQHVTALIEPVMNGEADMTVSLRENSLAIYRYFKLDFISGERVFKKSLFGDLDRLAQLPGFALEVYLNKIVVERRLRLKSVDCEKLVTPRRAVKVGWIKGHLGDLKTTLDVARGGGYFGVGVQFYKMKKLCVD